MGNDREDGSRVEQASAPAGLGRGDSIGRYLVLGLVGKGGMGEVYAAYDPELDRKVALKLLRARAAAGVDPSVGRARLLREAQAIARLSDPNVVVVFDVGTFGDRVFLAMEFVDGNTLSYWLQAQPRSWRDVIRTYLAAGRGLASAHRAGLVHRDFKPDNVMITRDGQIRVMDFGLARTIDEDGEAKPATAADKARAPASRLDSGEQSGGKNDAPAEWSPGAGRTRIKTSGGGVPVTVTSDPSARILPALATAVRVHADWNEADVATRDLAAGALPVRPGSPTTAFSAPLTLTGAMMGTPAYMAPEQFNGQPLDARSDQFSFCVALYEGLYGERPFEGKNIHDLTANVLAGKVRAAPAKAKARVPGWLRRVVLRGLRLDRTQRFPSMEALLATLAKDPSRTRRRWAAAAAVAGLIAVLGAGLVRAEREKLTRCLGADTKLAGVWELPVGQGALSPRKEAIRRAFMATGKRYAADSFEVVRNALDRYVTDWNTMHRESCEATNIRGEQSAEVLDLRTSCLQDRFAEVRALTNVFSDATSDVVTKSVEAVQSIRAVEQCADIAALRAVVRPPDDPEIRRAVADVRTQLADVKALATAGRYKQALIEIPRVVEAARRTKYDAVIAEALLQVGVLHGTDGDDIAAATELEEAVLLAEGARHDEVVVEGEAELIFVVGYQQHRAAEAERLARHAAAVLRRLGPGHDVVAAWRTHNLAAVLDYEGRSEEALRASKEALALKISALGERDPDVGMTLLNLALYLFRLGRTEEAIAHNERALRILRSTIGETHPLVAMCLANGSEMMTATHEYVRAQRMAEDALGIWERELPPDHPHLAFALTSLGLSMLEQANAAAAIAPLNRALVILERRRSDKALLAETQFVLARAMHDAHHATEEALALARTARANLEGQPSARLSVTVVDAWIQARVPPHAISMR